MAPLLNLKFKKGMLIIRKNFRRGKIHIVDMHECYFTEICSSRAWFEQSCVWGQTSVPNFRAQHSGRISYLSQTEIFFFSCGWLLISQEVTKLLSFSVQECWAKSVASRAFSFRLGWV